MANTIIVNKQGRRYISTTKELIWKEYGGACAVLVQWFGCNDAKLWTQGAIVKGNLGIAEGTCIATFKNGIYPNLKTGNHAAVYLRQDAEGVEVYEQWNSLSKPQSRKILFKNDMSDLSNNANCFSVLLTTPNKYAPGYKLGYAGVGSNPATTPDSVRVIKQYMLKKHDKSVLTALKKALKDEVLTYQDILEIVESAKDGGGYNVSEIRAMKLILNRALTLDGKSRQLLETVIKNQG